MPFLTRRFVLAATALLPFARPARADGGIGRVQEVTGSASLVHQGETVPLAPGAELMEGDTALTEKDALALLMLNTETRINMGPESEIMLASYLADMGGVINVGGAIVFDRPEELAPVNLTFVTEFGEIGVRGTRFFVGPSKGEYAVFCQRGKVSVTGGGVTRDLGPGDGTNMVKDGAPSEVAQWKPARIEAAFALVGLKP